jgi:L-rhamnose mutarotase
MSERKCFALDLIEDAALIAEYEARHAPGAVWRAVMDHLRALGVEAMEIWRTGDRLFMIAETSADYPRPVPAPPEVAQWEEKMWRFQRPLPGSAAGEKWIEMRRIFVLEAQ